MTTPYQPTAATQVPPNPQPVASPTIIRDASHGYPAGSVPPMPQPPAPSAPTPTPTAPPQPSQPATFDALLDSIIPADSRYPKELHGRRMRDAMHFYNVMRQDFLTRNGAGQPMQPGQPAQPQSSATPSAAPPAGPPRLPGQPAPAQPSGAPDINQIVAEAVNAALARFQPVVEQTAMNASMVARTQAAQEFPDWQSYEPAILSALEGGNPGALANPEIWRNAYYFVKGRAMSQPAGTSTPAAGAAPSAPAAGHGVQSAPQPSSYFTERPTPPSTTGQPSAASGFLTPASMTPEQKLYASRFQMPEQEYCDWHNGVPSNGAHNGR
jgi:hypothetical protein